MIIKEYVRLDNLNNAYDLLMKNDKNMILGGGAWLKQKHTEVEMLIDISTVGLNEIIEVEDTIEVGAMTSLRQIEKSDILNNYAGGILPMAVKNIMGVNVRNIATIGGSVMGRYSFSDIFAPLLVMDVSLVFYKNGEVTLKEFLECKKPPRDILVKLIIKKTKAKGYFHTIKRTALDFSLLNIAIAKNSEVRIAIGSRPSIALRLYETEKLLESSEVTHDLIKEVSNKALEEIKLSSNQRASKEYREELLKVYLRRGLEEVYGFES